MRQDIAEIRRREAAAEQKHKALKTNGVNKEERKKVINDFLRNITTFSASEPLDDDWQVVFDRKSTKGQGREYHFAINDSQYKRDGILQWYPVDVHVKKVVVPEGKRGRDVYEAREWTKIDFTQLKRKAMTYENRDVFIMILLCDAELRLLRIFFVPSGDCFCTTKKTRLKVYNNGFEGMIPSELTWKDLSTYAFPREGNVDRGNLRDREGYQNLVVVDCEKTSYTKYSVDSDRTELKGTFEKTFFKFLEGQLDVCSSGSDSYVKLDRHKVVARKKNAAKKMSLTKDIKILSTGQVKKRSSMLYLTGLTKKRKACKVLDHSGREFYKRDDYKYYVMFGYKYDDDDDGNDPICAWVFQQESLLNEEGQLDKENIKLYPTTEDLSELLGCAWHGPYEDTHCYDLRTNQLDFHRALGRTGLHWDTVNTAADDADTKGYFTGNSVIKKLSEDQKHVLKSMIHGMTPKQISWFTASSPLFQKTMTPTQVSSFKKSLNGWNRNRR